MQILNPIKRIGFLVSMGMVIVSFLFYARKQALYNNLLIFGLFISFACFLMIVFGKGTLKSKLIWSGVLVVSILLQRITEPLFIKKSYKIYVSQNEATLKSVNTLLLSRKVDIFIIIEQITFKGDSLSIQEQYALKQMRKKLGTYMIVKNDSSVYYGLWGFLDVRLGITYWSRETKPPVHYRNIKESWYH